MPGVVIDRLNGEDGGQPDSDGHDGNDAAAWGDSGAGASCIDSGLPAGKLLSCATLIAGTQRDRDRDVLRGSSRDARASAIRSLDDLSQASVAVTVVIVSSHIR